MTTEEIIKAIAEYNAAETLQRERLAQIYLAIKSRSGYREVRFGIGEMWSNCWDKNMPDVLALPRFVDPHHHQITSWNLGGD